MSGEYYTVPTWLKLFPVHIRLSVQRINMSINYDFSSGEALMNMMELGVNNPPVFFMERMYNEYISRVDRGEIFPPRYNDTVCKVIDIVNEARGAAQKRALFGSGNEKGKIIIFFKFFTC